jgi:hypothetical protein
MRWNTAGIRTQILSFLSLARTIEPTKAYIVHKNTFRISLTQWHGWKQCDQPSSFAIWEKDSRALQCRTESWQLICQMFTIKNSFSIIFFVLKVELNNWAVSRTLSSIFQNISGTDVMIFLNFRSKILRNIFAVKLSEKIGVFCSKQS